MFHPAEAPAMQQPSDKLEVKHGKTIEQIRAALEKDIRINLHRYPIKLAFAGYDLVLTGELGNIAEKKIVLELAAAMAPKTGIVDRLRVTPAQPMSDAELRDHVVKVLLEEPALEHCLLHSRLPKQLQTHRHGIPEPIGTIVVEVSDGVVTLNGEVPSLSHKRLAGVLAWWVPGCRKKDPFINATKTRVTSKDGVVTLTGLVPSETMKRMAERDAWFVLGVREVVNQIAVKW